MKVLRVGSLIDQQTYQTTCNKCHSILEFQKHEAKFMFERNEGLFCIKCPVCQFNIYISEQALKQKLVSNQSDDFRDQPFEPK